MNAGDEKLDKILNKLAPVMLPPADYPPAVIVRDTPRDELLWRIRDNAAQVNIELTDEHFEVINFLLDFYIRCCAADELGYTDILSYWRKVDLQKESGGAAGREEASSDACRYGQLSAREATNAYRVYRILLKAFRDKGGKRFLYRLFPYGPLFTIHLLAQLPRLRHDVDPHFGTAY